MDEEFLQKLHHVLLEVRPLSLPLVPTFSNPIYSWSFDLTRYMSKKVRWCVRTVIMSTPSPTVYPTWYAAFLHHLSLRWCSGRLIIGHLLASCRAWNRIIWADICHKEGDRLPAVVRGTKGCLFLFECGTGRPQVCGVGGDCPSLHNLLLPQTPTWSS